jgi:toxin YoeB
MAKISTLVAAIAQDPFEGIGKPEPLKYGLTGSWSRRINQEHRIVYEVLDERIVIHSLKGHYS